MTNQLAFGEKTEPISHHPPKDLHISDFIITDTLPIKNSGYSEVYIYQL
jgi:hypothetical protein